MAHQRVEDAVDGTPGSSVSAVDLNASCSSLPLKSSDQARPVDVPADSLKLPERYGVDGVMLMCQDPSILYCYWEVVPESLAHCLEHLANGARYVLRILPEEDEFFDVEVTDSVGACYIRLKRGGGSCSVVFGVKTRDGSFIPILRSNKLVLPPLSVSDVEDESWAGGAEFNAQVFRDLAELPEGPSSLHSFGLRFHDWSSASLVKKNSARTSE